MKHVRRVRSESLEHRLMLDATAEWLTDFNTTPRENQPHAWLGSELFFAADDGTGDVELWKSDGTTEGTTRVMDIRAGRFGSFPEGFVTANDRVFFTAYDDETGRELWSTDGTTEGTKLVRDVEPGPADGFVYSHGFSELDGQVYFTRTTRESVHQFWSSDGTEAGTRVISNFDEDTYTSNYVVHNGTIYFTARTPTSSFIWESDGTEEGTRPLVDVVDNVDWLAAVGNSLVYVERSWIRTTWQLKRFDLQTQVTTTLHEETGESWTNGPTLVGDSVFFLVRRRNFQSEDVSLWRTDGTEAVMLRDFGNQYLSNVTAIGDEVYFLVNQALWRSDGTPDGTRAVPGVQRNSYGSLREADGSLYAQRYEPGDVESNLVRLDGDEATEISTLPGKEVARAALLSARDGKAYYWAKDDARLWVGDGTPEGTGALDVTISGATEGYGINAVQPVEGGVVAFVDDELWMSDGTTEGTTRIAESTRINTYYADPISHQGKAYFVVDDNGLDVSGLWRTDGTTEGTVPIKPNEMAEPLEEVRNLVVSDDQLFFSAYDQEGFWLWSSDGSSQGTTRVLDLDAFELEPRFLTDVNGTLYFIDIQAEEFELWRTDGTSEGTQIVAPLGQLDAFNDSIRLIGDENSLFVASRSNGTTIWSSDGTEAGTVKVLESGNYSGWYELLDGKLLFPFQNETDDEPAGQEMWISDGTVAGTTLLKDIVPGPDGSYPSLGIVWNNHLFFGANGELWKTDGTESGTVRVSDVGPVNPYFYSNAGNMIVANGLLYFAGQDDNGTQGSENELWRTDGTEEGTVQVSDINPGDRSSSPKYFAEANGSLFFRADDGFHGQNLYRLTLPPVPGDSNGDGVFNSTDLVYVFQRGEYEDGVAKNSTFADGDWNGDGDFDSSDFVFAFQAGNYEATPEPGSMAAIAASIWASRNDDALRKRQRNEFDSIDVALKDELFPETILE